MKKQRKTMHAKTSGQKQNAMKISAPAQIRVCDVYATFRSSHTHVDVGGVAPKDGALQQLAVAAPASDTLSSDTYMYD